jgi:hypothetical protein
MQTFYVADIYKHAGAFWVYPLDLLGVVLKWSDQPPL